MSKRQLEKWASSSVQQGTTAWCSGHTRTPVLCPKPAPALFLQFCWDFLLKKETRCQWLVFSRPPPSTGRPSGKLKTTQIIFWARTHGDYHICSRFSFSKQHACLMGLSLSQPDASVCSDASMSGSSRQREGIIRLLHPCRPGWEVLPGNRGLKSCYILYPHLFQNPYEF